MQSVVELMTALIVVYWIVSEHEWVVDETELTVASHVLQSDAVWSGVAQCVAGQLVLICAGQCKVGDPL